MDIDESRRIGLEGTVFDLGRFGPNWGLRIWGLGPWVWDLHLA